MPVGLCVFRFNEEPFLNSSVVDPKLLLLLASVLLFDRLRSKNDEVSEVLRDRLAIVELWPEGPVDFLPRVEDEIRLFDDLDPGVLHEVEFEE